MPELPEVETVRRVLEPQLAGVVAWGIEGDAMIPEEYLRGQGKEYRNAERLRAYGRARRSEATAATSATSVRSSQRFRIACVARWGGRR